MRFAWIAAAAAVLLLPGCPRPPGTPGTPGPSAGAGDGGTSGACGDVGRPCGSGCPAGLTCQAGAHGDFCVVERTLCGGFAAARCDETLLCLDVSGGDFGVCVTDAERACICARAPGAVRGC